MYILYMFYVTVAVYVYLFQFILYILASLYTEALHNIKVL